jgi:hypothetical protein
MRLDPIGWFLMNRMCGQEFDEKKNSSVQKCDRFASGHRTCNQRAWVEFPEQALGKNVGLGANNGRGWRSNVTLRSAPCESSSVGK